MLTESLALQGTPRLHIDQMQLILAWVGVEIGAGHHVLERSQRRVVCLPYRTRSLVQTRCSQASQQRASADASREIEVADAPREIEVARRIYVGNLAYSVAWQDLKDHFKPVGQGTAAAAMDVEQDSGLGLV